uniref:Uncharacterized protein n=1 Tax=Pararge aegeria TaxID=116150 RepID=S4P3A1_9NEOP
MVCIRNTHIVLLQVVGISFFCKTAILQLMGFNAQISLDLSCRILYDNDHILFLNSISFFMSHFSGNTPLVN